MRDGNGACCRDGELPEGRVFGGESDPCRTKLCESLGGLVRPGGILQAEHCVQTLSDAGKVCSDATDCLGRCILLDDTSPDLQPGTAETGVCEVDDSPFGCTALVNDGRYEGTICID